MRGVLFDGTDILPALAAGYDNQGYLYQESTRDFLQLERGIYLVGSHEIFIPDFELHAGAAEIPEPLLAQLAVGGRLVVPIGPPERQRVRVVRRRKTDFAQEDGEIVVFVPLVGKFGRAGLAG